MADDDDDYRDESSVCTSSSSSWATSDDERRFAPIVRRKKKRAEVVQSLLPGEVSTAESLTPTKDNVVENQNTESPRKRPAKRKKHKAASRKGGKRNETAEASSPTKQQIRVGEKSIAKSPTKKSPVKKSQTQKKAVAPPTKEMMSPVVQSPAKKKKAKEPKVLQSSPKKSPKKKKKETTTNSEVVTTPTNKPKKKIVRAAKGLPSSIPNRPHTAPTKSKKKVLLSSDDDNTRRNYVPIKTQPLQSAPPKKSKFSLSSDDSSYSTDDSSDSDRLVTKKVIDIRDSQPNAYSKKTLESSDGEESDSSSSSDTTEPKPQISSNREIIRSVPSRTLSGESTDSSGPPIPLGLRPGRKERAMSLGSTDSEPPISLSMRPGGLSRTISAESTDSEPPISLSLRPGKIQRSMSNDTTDDSEPPLSLSLRPGTLKRSMSTGTVDSEPPFSMDLRPGGGMPRTYSASSTDSEPPFSLSIRPGAPMRTHSHKSASSNEPEPKFPIGIRSRASIKEVDVDEQKRIDYVMERMNLRSLPRSNSIESTDSEPPIPLGLRPGAPNLTISGLDLAPGQFSDEKRNYEPHATAFGRPRKSRPFVPCPSYVPTNEAEPDVESMYRAAIAKKVEAEINLGSQQSKDSGPQILQGVRPSMPNLTISGLDLAQGQFFGEGNYELPGAAFGKNRKSRPFVPCPSYVPSHEGRADVESMYRSALSKKAESTKLVVNQEDTTEPQNLSSSCSQGLLQNSSANTSIGKNTMALQDEAHYDPLSEVTLRHVPTTAKPKKKNRRRRESFLFRDLQRFAKKTANELRSDDEGLSDEASEELYGEQSLNLMDAMEDSTNPSGSGHDFYESAPIAATQTSLSGKSGVIEPITPKFEEIRKTFLRMSAMNEPNDGESNKRRHSTLTSKEASHLSEKPFRRHSTFTQGVASIDVSTNSDSPCNGELYRLPQAGCISPQRRVESNQTSQQVETNSSVSVQKQPIGSVGEQRKAPIRVPSASLTNVVSLQDRIKLLSLADGGTGHKRSDESSSNLYGSPQKNRLTKIAESDPKKSAHNTVSSSMDALLSPRKDFSSKKSIQNPHVQYRTLGRSNENQGKQSFHKSVGTIPCLGSDEKKAFQINKPIWADKALSLSKSPVKCVEQNNDSLGDLRATVEALHKEIDEVEQAAKSQVEGDISCSTCNIDDNDEFVASETGLSKFFSTAKASGSGMKTDVDDKSVESALTYDVQDVLTSFSQQKKLAMERARASRPKGGKLNDRIKFLQSS